MTLAKPDLRWPPGFERHPVRFVASGAAWRGFALAMVLGVMCIPLLVCSILLLPWLPLVARVVDQFGAAGARWMGVTVSRRTPRHWLDWTQLANLGCQGVLSLIALGVVGFLATIVVLLVALPFAILIFEPDSEFTIGPWVMTGLPEIFLSCWLLTLVTGLATLYLSWLVAGASVFATASTNSPSREEINQLKRSRSVLIDAFTGERTRIERELHDGVQQYLTALQLNIAAAELRAMESPQVAEPLDDAKLNARRALEALRATIRGIYPQVLADKGLVEALRELTAHSGLDGDIRQTVSPGTTTSLHATPALLLYHCASEGITNASRHGGATRVEVAVHFGDSDVAIIVDDDGHGQSPPQGQPDSGSGIAGLRERASALGGSVELIGVSPLGGARLAMSLPRTDWADDTGSAERERVK